jgi:hypothetical protein
VDRIRITVLMAAGERGKDIGAQAAAAVAGNEVLVLDARARSRT